jgi:hypothetical protein
MVEWCVPLPNIHEAFGLILDLKVAVLKFFMGLLKHFEERYGTMLSVGQVLLQYPFQFTIHNNYPIS